MQFSESVFLRLWQVQLPRDHEAISELLRRTFAGHVAWGAVLSCAGLLPGKESTCALATDPRESGLAMSGG